MNKVKNFINKFMIIVAVILAAVSPSHSDVQLPDGKYYLDIDDLKVKVLGGYVSVKRTWYEKQWHFNRAWNNLSIEYSSLDSSVKSIDRNGDVYKKLSSLKTSYTFGNRSKINKTSSGFTWSNNKGRKIEYNNAGVILYFTDRNNIKVSFEYDVDGKRTAVLDHHGNKVINFEYNLDGKVSRAFDGTAREVLYNYVNTDLTEVIDVLGNSWKYIYDSIGYLKKKTTPKNHNTTIEYDANGRVSALLNHNNDKTLYSYNYDKTKKQYFTRVTTPENRVYESWYNSDGTPERSARNGVDITTIIYDGRSQIQTDKSGNKTRLDYDEWDNLISITNPDASFKSFKYENKYFQIIESINERGVKTLFDYDANGNLIRKKEAVGTSVERIIEYVRDQYGYRKELKQLGDTNTTLAVTKYNYDSFGNQISIIDPEGVSVSYTYDVMGNVLTSTNVDNKVWANTYNNAGQILSEKDPLNRLTKYEYDEVSNLIKVTNTDNSITLYSYNENGQLISTTDHLDGKSSTLYDKDGLVTERKDEVGNVGNTSYDAYRRPVFVSVGQEKVADYTYAEDTAGLAGLPSVTTYATHKQEFFYDKNLRLTKVTIKPNTGQSISISNTYDDVGNIVTGVNPLNDSEAYDYDELNRLIRKTNAQNKATEYSYDNRNNRIAYKDANNGIYRFEFNRNDQLTKKIRPLGQATEYFYNVLGQLSKKVDAKGQRIEYIYNEVGNLSTENHYPTLTSTTAIKTIAYSYNAFNNMTGYNDGTTSTVYGYDELQRNINKTVNYGGFSLAHSYTYFPNGLTKTFTDPDSVITTYGYDTENRLRSIQIPGQGNIVVNTYLNALPTKITLPGGVVQQAIYDDLLRPTSIVSKDAASNPVLSLQYEYDLIGRVAAKTSAKGRTVYTYDKLHQLTHVDHPVGQDENYTYDAVGNRLTDISGLTWVYNKNNELQSHNGITYKYDLKGNRSEKNNAGDITNYSYDIDNNLSAVKDTNNALIASYYHDPFAKRLYKELSGQRQYFHYSKEGLNAEYSSIGILIQSYGYNPRGLWTTDPIFTKNQQGYAFYHNDILGTPKLITNITGAVQWQANTTNEFGDIQITTSTVSNPIRLPGQYADNETGLHYNHLRSYDKTTGRYIQVDPAGLSGSRNLYSYAGNNPISYADPHGDWGFLIYVPEALAWAAGIYRGSKLARGLAGLLKAKTPKPAPATPGIPGGGSTPPFPICPPTFTRPPSSADGPSTGKPIPTITGEDSGAGTGGGDEGTADNDAPAPADAAPPAQPPGGGDDNNDGDNDAEGPFRNNREADQKARELGYKKTNYRSHGQPVYRKGNRYITRDVDGHNGGAWKMADSVKNLGSKKSRMGTFTRDLTTKVGG